MKFKLITLIVLSFSTLTSTFAQYGKRVKGDVVINPYYGFPNFGKYFLQSAEVAGNTVARVEGTEKGLGPLGLRINYSLTDNISLGLEAIYNDVSTDFIYEDVNSQGQIETYTGNVVMERYRIQVHFNYYFTVNSDFFEPYLGLGVGSNTRILNIEASGPGIADNSFASGIFVAFPVSSRVKFGSNFFFTDNIGANIEFGLGGPLLSAGLLLKL